MASLEIYEPLCEQEGCVYRATRQLKTETGTAYVYCTKHATPALVAANKAEREKAKAKP